MERTFWRMIFFLFLLFTLFQVYNKGYEDCARLNKDREWKKMRQELLAPIKSKPPIMPNVHE